MPTSNIGIVLEAERFLIEIFMVMVAMTGAVIVTSLILDNHGINPGKWWQKRQKTGKCHESSGHDIIKQSMVSGTERLKFCSEYGKSLPVNPKYCSPFLVI